MCAGAPATVLQLARRAIPAIIDRTMSRIMVSLLRNVRVAGSGCEPDTFSSKLERQEQADSRGLLRCINNRWCSVGIVLIAISVAVAMMIVMPIRLAWGSMALAMLLLLTAVVSLFRLQRRCCDEAADR
jgi:hypothetical protein